MKRIRHKDDTNRESQYMDKNISEENKIEKEVLEAIIEINWRRRRKSSSKNIQLKSTHYPSGKTE